MPFVTYTGADNRIVGHHASEPQDGLNFIEIPQGQYDSQLNAQPGPYAVDPGSGRFIYRENNNINDIERTNITAFFVDWTQPVIEAPRILEVTIPAIVDFDGSWRMRFHLLEGGELTQHDFWLQQAQPIGNSTRSRFTYRSQGQTAIVSRISDRKIRIQSGDVGTGVIRVVFTKAGATNNE